MEHHAPQINSAPLKREDTDLRAATLPSAGQSNGATESSGQSIFARLFSFETKAQERLFSNAAHASELLHLLARSSIEETKGTVTATRISLAEQLEVGKNIRHLERWVKSFRKRGRVRPAYQKLLEEASTAVKHTFPTSSRRERKQLTKELVVVAVLRGALDSRSLGEPKSADSLVSGLRSANRSWWIDRTIIYPLLAAALIPAGIKAEQRFEELGMMPDPVHYATRTENDVLQEAAQVLRVQGRDQDADWIAGLDIVALQKEVFLNLGLSDEEAEAHIRRDGLNHLGFTPLPFGQSPEDGMYIVNATYQPLFDTIQLNDRRLNHGTLVHELCHRNGHFGASSLQESFTREGPHVELEEGLCNLAGHRLSAVKNYPNALSTSMLAILVGMDAEVPQSPEEVRAAYERGLPILGRAFMYDNSLEPIRSIIDRRYGTGTFSRLVYEPFQSGSGPAKMHAAFLSELERQGVNPVTVLTMYEDQLDADRQISRSGASELERVTQTVITATYSDLDSFIMDADNALDIADRYSGSSLSDLYRYAAIMQLEMANGQAPRVLAELERGAASGSVNPWWGQMALLYARRGFDAGAIDADQALSLVERVIGEYPEGRLAFQADYVLRHIIQNLDWNRAAN